MQVNAVSLKNQSFGMSNEEILNGIANLNERDIRYLAKAKTLEDINAKKHRRLNNALTLSIPVAGGIAAAATMKATRLGRIANFASGFGAWAMPLLVGFGVVKAVNALGRNSETFANFDRKHPILSNIACVAGAYAGLRGIEKLGSSLVSKYGAKVLDKFAPQISKISKKLDKSALLNKASKSLKALHPSMKEVAKTGLKIAPWALLVTGFLHWIKYSAVKANQYVNNYYQIKAAQTQAQGYLEGQAKCAEEI